MRTFGYLATATLMVAPVLLASAPAEAYTARQAALQGRGIYITSKGVPEGYGGGYYPQANGTYVYRRGYHPRGWGFADHPVYDVE